MKLFLYVNTIRFLKLKQIFYRVFYFLFSVGAPIEPDVYIRIRSNYLRSFASRSRSLLGPTRFFLLNKEHSLNEIGWSGPQVEKLWRYNQHYFDDLNAVGSLTRTKWHIDLLNNWVAKNPAREGVGWEPYPTSLRIVNWIKWSLSGNTLPEACVKSLAVQTSWLSNRVEFHILGNHLFANAKALVFSGLFFKGKDAENWFEKGINIISNELEEQVLLDGGNFELSPMYHGVFLEDLLDLINISYTYPGKISNATLDFLLVKASEMLNWLKIMTHPDGEIAFFNDAVFNISPNPSELIAYAKRLNIPVEDGITRKDLVHLKQSGYIRVTTKNSTAFLDVAKIGPDYLPGHAHADSLSFELSIFGERVFVNGGVSLYESGDIRDYERSTAAHNTVVIDGESSSEVWGSFRVAKRAYPFGLSIGKDEDQVRISCSHNGYHRLEGKPTHKRKWIFRDNEIVVSDIVEGDFNSATAHFHLHPLVKVLERHKSECTLQISNLKNIKIKITKGSLSIKDGFYSPEFGKRLKTKCLAVNLIDGQSKLKVSIIF